MARRAPKSNRPARPSSTPAKRKGIPLSPLAQRMLQDLQLAGLAGATHEFITVTGAGHGLSGAKSDRVAEIARQAAEFVRMHVR